jgi:hypothetical protein
MWLWEKIGRILITDRTVISMDCKSGKFWATRRRGELVDGLLMKYVKRQAKQCALRRCMYVVGVAFITSESSDESQRGCQAQGAKSSAQAQVPNLSLSYQIKHGSAAGLST